MRIESGDGSTPKEQQSPAVSPRLVNAAHEFEAQMMKELLKPMAGLDGLTEEEKGAGEGTGSGGALGEFASEALAQAISRQGGFGIANRIIHELSRSGNSSAGANQKAARPGNLK